MAIANGQNFSIGLVVIRQDCDLGIGLIHEYTSLLFNTLELPQGQGTRATITLFDPLTGQGQGRLGTMHKIRQGVALSHLKVVMDDGGGGIKLILGAVWPNDVESNGWHRI